MTERIKIENEIKKLFEILMFGQKDEFKQAKKNLEHIFQHNYQSNYLRKAILVVFDYLPKFDQIKRVENQSAFVSGLSFFYLYLADEHFEVLKDFTLKVLQNKNGHLREAMRHTADWLYGSLASRANPFVYPEGKKLSEKQIIEKKIAIKQYQELVKTLEDLIGKYDDGSDKSEYIDEMKPSIHKTLQLFYYRFIDNRVWQKIISENQPVTFEVFMKRQEITANFNKFLDKHKFDYDFNDIKDFIYNEESTKDFKKLIEIFAQNIDLSKDKNILQLLNDTWNYFPHKILDGQCPAEKMMEYRSLHG